jgi:hypothetical protein
MKHFKNLIFFWCSLTTRRQSLPLFHQHLSTLLSINVFISQTKVTLDSPPYGKFSQDSLSAVKISCSFGLFFLKIFFYRRDLMKSRKKSLFKKKMQNHPFDPSLSFHQARAIRKCQAELSILSRVSFNHHHLLIKE